MSHFQFISADTTGNQWILASRNPLFSFHSRPRVDGVHAHREERIYQEYQKQEKAAQDGGKAGADGKAGEDGGAGEDWAGEAYESSAGDKVCLVCPRTHSPLLSMPLLSSTGF